MGEHSDGEYAVRVPFEIMIFFLVHPVGFEPTTHRLRGGCSTN